LYQHLHALAQHKIPIPKPTYYSFDCDQGALVQQLEPLKASASAPSSALTAGRVTLADLTLPAVDGEIGEIGELEEDFSSSWADIEIPRKLWSPHNPEYDPGPPPPPRVPRPEMAEPTIYGSVHGSEAGSSVGSSFGSVSGSGLNTSPKNKRRGNQQVFSNALPITRARHGGGSGSPPGPRGGNWGSAPRHGSGRPVPSVNPPQFQPRSASPPHTHMQRPASANSNASLRVRSPPPFNGARAGSGSGQGRSQGQGQRGLWMPPPARSNVADVDASL
jgi:hypothetical protein